MRDATERVRKYELMVIFSPDVAEEELPAAIDKVAGFVSTFGGTVTTVLRDSPWGRRRLAYPIRFTGRDIRDGFYVLYYFDADSLTIVEIERELKLFDRVMRHMLILQVAPLIVPEAPPEAAAAPTLAVSADGSPIAATPAAEGDGSPSAETPAESAESASGSATPTGDAANVAPAADTVDVAEPVAETVTEAHPIASAPEASPAEHATHDSPTESVPTAEPAESQDSIETPKHPSSKVDDTPAS